MSFEDLPENLRELPLTDDVLAADAVDLFCSVRARAGGCVLVIVCDDLGRPLQPILLTERPDRAGRTISRHALRHLAEAAADGGSAVIALGKPDGPIDDLDRVLHQQLLDAFGAAGVPIHGAFLATPGRIVRMPDFTMFARLG